MLSAVASYVYLPATFAGLSGVASEVSRQPGDPRLILAAAVVIGVVPVSYTHLDVYKRQIENPS